MTRIVAATDGSEHATTALRWAAEMAELHGSRLEVALAWNLLDQHHPDHSEAFDHQYTQASAEATLAAWVTEALGPEAEVDLRAVNDLPVPALVDLSDAADLLVVGARGTGGFEGLVLGSVSERVAQLSTRPVAVVRNAAPVRGGRVVVGIDGSERSRVALRWAAEEARAREAELDVVYAWRLPLLATSPAIGSVATYSALEQSGRALLDEAVADPALDGLQVHPHFVVGRPAKALLERADGAGLLVAGSRGLGRVGGAVLGSVSRQLVQHSPIPVVVI